MDELKFSQIDCQFKSFDFWLSIYGFSRIEYLKETKEISVEYKQPLDLVFHLTEGIECAFQFSTYAPSYSKTSKAIVKQVCEISLSHNSKSLTGFEELFSMFETFEKFLTLSYFGKPIIKKLFLRTKTLSKKNEEYYKTVEIHFQTPSLNGKLHRRNHSNYFLFTFKIIQENFQEILSNWFNAKTKLEPTINGLTEAFSVREQLSEFKFLNLAHALETYHQRKEKENRGKASQTLFQKRLEALSNLIPPEIKFLLFKPSEKEFIENIKNSRNYYTHYSEEKEATALKGSDLFYLSERMKIFLVCLILKEIGFTDAEVVKTILRKGVFLFNHIIKYDEAKKYFQDW